MNRSPGHQKWPEHKVEERNFTRNLQVSVDGKVVADSTSVIEVDEDKHPARFYFPRSDINTTLLQPSDTTTHCPFKGKARYFHLNSDGKTIENAAWSYEEPYEEHRALQDRVAFHDEKPDIEIKR